MKPEFKVGDEVIYNCVKYTVKSVGAVCCEIVNDTTHTYVPFKDLTHVKVAPTVRETEAVISALDQLELEFGELTGDLPEFTRKEVNSDVYCSCSIPEVIKNQAYGNSFLFCKGCRKERI